MKKSKKGNDTTMGRKDKNPLHERILDLTLEIIYVLTGEDYIVTKKCVDGVPSSCPDCMLEGSCRRHNPAVVYLSRSAVQKENTKKILRLISNILRLLTGEVAMRYEDVSDYFTLEEWEDLKENKPFYREMIMEDSPQFHLFDFETEDTSNIKAILGSNLCRKNKASLRQSEIKGEEGVFHGANHQLSLSDQAGLDTFTSVVIKTEPYSREQIQGSSSATQTLHSTLNCHTSDNEISPNMKQESGEDDQSHCITNSLTGTIQRTDPSQPVMGYSQHGSLSANDTLHNIKEEPDSWEMDHANCVIDPFRVKIEGSDMAYQLTNNLSVNDESEDESKEETASWEGEQSDNDSTAQRMNDPSNPVIRPHLMNAFPEMEFNEFSDNFQDETSITSHLNALQAAHGCAVCYKHFTSNRDLVRHMRTHTGEKPFICPECAKCFNDNSILVRHMKIHTGEKPFPCPDCGRSFRRRAHLVVHERTHTGERPFTCPECGKSFARRSHLMDHRIIHRGEKNYSCPECGKCFGLQGYLNKHFKIHTIKVAVP